MSYTLEDFCRDANAALKADNGPASRQKIRVLLEDLLANKDFVETAVGDGVEIGVHTLYRDPELDFVVLAHVNDVARKSPPHDHGTSWAVYGQAKGYTDMTEYDRLDGGSGVGKADIKLVKSYRLTPGKAGVFDVGDIHAIDYPDGARFVRVTGTALEEVARLKFDMAAGEAQEIASQGVN